MLKYATGFLTFSMTLVPSTAISFFDGMYHSQILSKLFILGTHSEKSTKRLDLKGLKVVEIVRIMLHDPILLSLLLAGPLLIGLSRLYLKDFCQYALELSCAANSSSSESVVVSSVVPSTVKRRSRSTAMSNLQTPLRAIPEEESLAFLEDVLFENQPTVSFPSILASLPRTPVSSRKRLSSSTPRSSSWDNEADFGTPDEKRLRRVSALSEVMDTLRADDGERRLSGLLGTTGNVDAFHDEDDGFGYDGDEFDTGINPPVSPLTTLLAPAALLDNRNIQRPPRSLKNTTFRTFMDKKGQSLFSKNEFAQERRRIANWLAPRQTKPIINFQLFPLSDFQNKTSHVLWRPTVAAQQRKQPVFVSAAAPRADDFVCEDLPSDEGFFNDSYSQQEPPKLQLGQTLASTFGSKSTRLQAVQSFVEILHLANQGAIKLSQEKVATVDSVTIVLVN